MATTKHLCWGQAEVLSETDGKAWSLQPGQMCTSLLLPVRCVQGFGFLADLKGTWHRSLIPSLCRFVLLLDGSANTLVLRPCGAYILEG